MRGGRPSVKPAKVAEKAAAKAGDRVGAKLKDVVSEKVDEAGGAGGLVKDAASGLIPGLGGGDSGGGNGGMPGVGKGRRMPVQQSVDVAVPLETAYNQFTQFEDWPEFMHRVTRVTQEDDCTVSSPRRSGARRSSSRPTSRPAARPADQVEGVEGHHTLRRRDLPPARAPAHPHRAQLRCRSRLADREGRTWHAPRQGAARADLHRFKAFIEMSEPETGTWRGVIEDGELVDRTTTPMTRNATTPTSRRSRTSPNTTTSNSRTSRTPKSPATAAAASGGSDSRARPSGAAAQGGASRPPPSPPLADRNCG